jgi:3-oxoacyl-[acyl-carrier-protein] synthase II
MSERIAITGAGIISAIGAGKEETMRFLLDGRSGIGPLRHLQTIHDFPCGEVAMSNDELRTLLGIPADKIIARTTLLGIYAVREALRQASSVTKSSIQDHSGTKLSLVSGTTVAGMDVTEEHFLEALRTGEYDDLLRTHTCGSSTRDIADYFGIFDSLTTTSTACSSAANSMILAARLIRSGRADVVVAGGSECLSKYHLNGFNSLMILDQEPCRPFDAERAGLNLGEGAGFVVMESEKHAADRGAQIIGYLDGYGNSCDAYHQTASSPEGDGAFKAMRQAIEMAGLKPEDINYINAHGTGTVNNDESESHALHRVFGDDVPPVSSTKSFTGHATSASGGIEAVICLIAMQNGFIPANLRFSKPFEGGIMPVSKGRKATLNHVLCNSFAFGGNDTSLLFSRI